MARARERSRFCALLIRQHPVAARLHIDMPSYTALLRRLLALFTLISTVTPQRSLLAMQQLIQRDEVRTVQFRTNGYEPARRSS